MEWSTSLQHLIHLSQEYKLPLIAVKLDISSAFDHISHEAVASYLAGPRLESLLLLKIFVLSRVALSIYGDLAPKTFQNPCVRPVSAVNQCLSVMHNTARFISWPLDGTFRYFLLFELDNSPLGQYIRCAHKLWVTCTNSPSPLNVVTRIRDTLWLHSYWRTHRRQLGFWPNAYRFGTNFAVLATPPFGKMEH